jgi:two-component system sensor histidine kinase KdpD
VLVESIGGTYHQVSGADIPDRAARVRPRRQRDPTRPGRERRGRLAQLFARGVGVTTTAESGSIDVHLVTHEEVRRGRRGSKSPAG